MARVIIREERCKSCELCITVCPKGIIVISKHINEMGYHPATVEEQEKCTGCALCALICPDLAIQVERKAKSA